MKIITLMENTALTPGLACEHGLSLYIELETREGLRRILFDMGQSAAFLDNARALGVDLSLVDTAILSHGHYDHGGGLAAFLEVNDHAPVYMQETAFGGHYSGGWERYIGLDSALKKHAASGRIRLTGEETALGEGLTLVSCNALERPFPSSVKGMLLERGGALGQDLFLHEQYLVIEEGGRRTVISGCSHKGVLNIMRWLKPDVLIGGFHFMKLDPDGEDRLLLEDAAARLAAYGATYYTCHCTGLPAYDFLRGIMGGQLAYLAAGAEIVI
ncbi:MAG: MBL fold metallo-hydrolase [Clostridia bacterium]|nr:MBL fold metallo-hydrolase [Clostridia bacterium]